MFTNATVLELYAAARRTEDLRERRLRPSRGGRTERFSRLAAFAQRFGAPGCERHTPRPAHQPPMITPADA